MTVQQINVNPKGGVPKTRVAEAFISVGGVGGDKQRNLRLHGGPLRAVCLFSAEIIEALQRGGHPIKAGSTGENLTLAHLDWTQIKPGVRLRVGECELEISSYTVPCTKITFCFSDGDFKRLSQKLYPGNSRVYARVCKEGTVREGDAVEFISTGEFDRTLPL